MKSILLWDPRFPNAAPTRLSVHDDLASAAVRAGIAAAADPREAGALSTGAPVSSADPVLVVLQHGANKRLTSVSLPRSVAEVGATLGVVCSKDGQALNSATPTPVANVRYAMFGDSIDAPTGTGLGNIAINTNEPWVALQRLMWPIDFDSFFDPYSLRYQYITNTLGYVGSQQSPQKGQNFAIGGAGLGQIVAEFQQAYDEGYRPQAITIGGGVNSTTDNEASYKAKEQAIYDKVFSLWPNVKVGRVLIRPNASGGLARFTPQQTQDRRDWTLAILAQNATRGGGVTAINTFAKYQPGGPGTYAPSDYIQGDQLHPAVKGVGFGAAAYLPWLTATFGAGTLADNAVKRRRKASYMIPALRDMSGTPSAINVAAGAAPNAGTITGFTPPQITLAKQGNCNSNITCAVLPHPFDATKSMLRIRVEVVTGNGTERFIIRQPSFRATGVIPLTDYYEGYSVIQDDSSTSKLIEVSLNASERIVVNTQSQTTARFDSDDRVSAQRQTMLLLPHRLANPVNAATDNTISWSMGFVVDTSVAGTFDFYLVEHDIQTRTLPYGAVAVGPNTLTLSGPLQVGVAATVDVIGAGMQFNGGPPSTLACNVPGMTPSYYVPSQPVGETRLGRWRLTGTPTQAGTFADGLTETIISTLAGTPAVKQSSVVVSP